jgi:hypothetical protein
VGDFGLFFELDASGGNGFGWGVVVDRVLGAENHGGVGVGQAAVAFRILVLGVDGFEQVLLRAFEFKVILGVFRFGILRGLMARPCVVRICVVRRVRVWDQPFGGIFELRVALGYEFFCDWVIF